MTRTGSSVAVTLLVAVGVYFLWQIVGASALGSFDTGLTDMTTPLGALGAQLVALAHAIATQEGFFVAGSVPAQAHNPGDLKIGDVGYGTLDNGITVFASDADGWTALYRQLLLIAHSQSHVYTPGMSFAAMGALWAGGDPTWGIGVSTILGTSVDTSIQGWLA